jgi:shikimate dehydrogenase
MTISGRTRLIAHLGYPTENFKAPMIYNPYFDKHGIDAVVVPMAAMNRLAERLRAHYPALKIEVGSRDPAGFDVVVNATTLGMKDDDPLPMDVARLSPSTFVGEVVMKREITPFLAAARARGCAIQVGTDMLFEQIPAYLEFFGFRTTTPDELRAVAQISY